MPFNFVQLALTVTVDRPELFLRQFPALCGDYAGVCHDIACRYPGRSCAGCDCMDECGWHLLFSQSLATDPAALKRYQKPPLPFVLSLPNRAAPGIDTSWVCRLLVIGSAIPHIGLLVRSFDSLISRSGRPFRCTLVRTECLGYQGGRQFISSAAFVDRAPELPELTVMSAADLNNGVADPDAIVLRLTSPLRLMEGSGLARQFSFSRFCMSVVRRVTAIAYYYGDGEIDCDFREVSGSVQRVVCMRHSFSYSSTGDTRTCGLLGSGVFSGELHAVMPFLLAGSMTSVGKGASHGMGSFELITHESADKELICI